MKTKLIIVVVFTGLLFACSQAVSEEPSSTSTMDQSTTEEPSWVNQLRGHEAAKGDAGSSPAAEKSTDISTWNPIMRRVAESLPKKNQMDEPKRGGWLGGAFVESEEGLPAVMAAYQEDQTSLVTGIKEDEGKPIVKSLPYDQSVQLVVIFAGELLVARRDEIIRRLEAESWSSDVVTLYGGEIEEYPYWYNDDESIYLVEVDGLLVYAHEREGAHIVGAGHSTSVGAHKITAFIESYFQK